MTRKAEPSLRHRAQDAQRNLPDAGLAPPVPAHTHGVEGSVDIRQRPTGARHYGGVDFAHRGVDRHRLGRAERVRHLPELVGTKSALPVQSFAQAWQAV
jgi:hypothetical protein